MRLVRFPFLIRLISCLLVASMLPVLLGPMGQAAPLSIQGSFEQWVRLQLRVPADPHLDAALDRAGESRARSFDDFLLVFLEAYEQLDPPAPAARAFTERDISNDALRSFLQRRFTEIGAEAVMPRLQQAAAPAPCSPTPGGSTAVAAPKDANSIFADSSEMHSTEMEHVVPARTLSSARSRGP